jgi:hypothetical protein
MYQQTGPSFIFVTMLLLQVSLVQPEDPETGFKTGSQTGSIREMRKLLLTKDNIEEHMARKQKEILIQNIPEPLEVRTSLVFSSDAGEPGN